MEQYFELFTAMQRAYEIIMNKLRYESTEPVVSISLTPSGHAYLTVTDNECNYIIERDLTGKYICRMREVESNDSK